MGLIVFVFSFLARSFADSSTNSIYDQNFYRILNNEEFSTQEQMEYVPTLLAHSKCCPSTPIQGPPGPTGPAGPTGPTGPTGTFAADFGFAFRLGAGGMTTIVNNGQPVLFSTLSNTPADTHITLSGNIVTITDTGFYQVNFGVTVIAAASPTIFTLEVDDVPFAQQAIENPTTVDVMVSSSVIVQLVGAGAHTLKLVNTSGAARSISDLYSGGTIVGPAAYMTIVKLQ